MCSRSVLKLRGLSETSCDSGKKNDGFSNGLLSREVFEKISSVLRVFEKHVL